MQLKGQTIDRLSLEVDGVDSHDYPDFCDAHFSYAEFKNSRAKKDYSGFVIRLTEVA
jgi:hypothetical protein